MPFIHLIDRFCLIRSDCVDSFDKLQTDGYFDIRLHFTHILALVLQQCFNKEHVTGMLKQVQSYVLTYTVQFIWHLHQQMSSLIA